jgi:ABC-type lipoprotein export system ATPase subunit
MAKYSGYTDRPAVTINEDLFNIEKYIQGLSRFILECNTPMTIAIQGDWGSGKTSFMNMIKGETKSLFHGSIPGNTLNSIWAMRFHYHLLDN